MSIVRRMHATSGLLGIVALLAVASSASAAGTNCRPLRTGAPFGVSVCVTVVGGSVNGYARIYAGQDPYFNPAYVWVRQCSGLGCVIFAQSGRKSGANIASTNSGRSLGLHNYQTCVHSYVTDSGRTYGPVDGCSDFVDGP